MSETTNSKTQAAFSIGKAMAFILGIAFVADFLIMAVLAQLGLVHKDSMVFILGAAILATVIGPPIYILVLSPLRNLGRRRHDMLAAAMIVDGRTDELTQVLNRQAITIDVVEAIAQSERYNNALALALVDVDHLQKINDEQGRDAGDEVLKAVANALTDALRLPDRIGRYAGEEFLVVLPQTVAEDASTIADRIILNYRVRPVRLMQPSVSV